MASSCLAARSNCPANDNNSKRNVRGAASAGLALTSCVTASIAADKSPASKISLAFMESPVKRERLEAAANRLERWPRPRVRQGAEWPPGAFNERPWPFYLRKKTGALGEAPRFWIPCRGFVRPFDWLSHPSP